MRLLRSSLRRKMYDLPETCAPITSSNECSACNFPLYCGGKGRGSRLLAG